MPRKPRLIGQRVPLIMYLDPPAAEALARLAKRDGTPKAQLVREAIEDLLQKHGETWERTREPDGTPAQPRRTRK